MDKETLKEKLVALNMKIDTVTDLFYQQKDVEANETMKFVIDDMMNVANGLDSYAKNNKGFAFDSNKFLTILKQILEAMAKKDYVLMADVLKYDFSEIINGYIESL